MSLILIVHDDARIVAQILDADRQRVATAILFLFLEQDEDFIGADPGAAGDGERPPAPRRQAIIAEGIGVEFDIVEIAKRDLLRSEEHTSELQSLMRNSYAVFCWKNTKKPS